MAKQKSAAPKSRSRSSPKSSSRSSAARGRASGPKTRGGQEKSSSNSTRMSKETKAKLEKSFRNKVEKTMQSDWHKVRRQGGTTYEEFVDSKVKELSKEYAKRRRTEERIVDKYQGTLRNCPNTTLKIGGSKSKYYAKTDDKGEIYQITSVDSKGKKETHNLPNKKVKLGGYEYETDEFGRTTKAKGTLQEKNHVGRLNNYVKMNDIGKGDQKETDNRGHLIADTFNGLPDLINLVAQDSTLNSENGDYNKLEKTLKEAVKQGKKVTLQVDVKYDKNEVSHRPIGFRIKYSIDGEYSKAYFKNQENQEE